MSNTSEPAQRPIKVFLPPEPPELTPRVAKALLAILWELSEAKMRAEGKPVEDWPFPPRTPLEPET